MARKNEAIEFSAKNLDLALVKAAGSFGVGRERLEYRILEEKKGGLFGLFQKPFIRISATLKRGSGSNGGAGSSRSSDSERNGSGGLTLERMEAVLTPQEQTTLVQELSSFCQEICGRMVGHPVTVRAELVDKRLALNIEDEFLEQQIGKNGKLAEALEHLLRKKPRHLKHELPFRIFVDAGDIRRKREEALVQMAGDLSEKVHENKRPIVLNYRSPYDRKIIHMALDKDERVYTKSIGAGANRKLMILPAKDKIEAEKVNA